MDQRLLMHFLICVEAFVYFTLFFFSLFFLNIYFEPLQRKRKTCFVGSYIWFYFDDVPRRWTRLTVDGSGDDGGSSLADFMKVRPELHFVFIFFIFIILKIEICNL